MHRSLTAALAAALWLVLAYGPAPAARGDAPPAEADARGRLSRGDARGAVAVLEASLPRADARTRPALLDALRAAYAAAARQAESEGKTADAESYRDDLDILSQTPRTPTTGPATPAASPAIPPPAPKPAVPGTDPNSAPGPEAPKADTGVEVAALTPSEPGEPVSPLPASVNPADNPPEPGDPEPVSPARKPAKDPALRPASTTSAPRPPSPTADPGPAPDPGPQPSRLPEPKPAPEGPTLASAVAAFKAEKYDEAGKLFASLHDAGKLPPGFKSHWAYCRAGEVVRRINARPGSPREWAAIDSEIQSIRDLSPSNWFAEYLRNLASERNRDPRTRPNRSNKVVVRGSSPDEPPLSSRPGDVSPAPAPAHVPVPPPAPVPVPATPIPWSRQPVESDNFVVKHVDKDRALAESAVRVAEATREAQVKRWGAASAAWSPKCEIVLFPTARDFARETLQAPESPGISTMGIAGGRVVLRRVNLRTDHPSMAQAILPHEVTHVVLADLFPSQQIPRWADEGMAVLAEPRSEQAVRAADLDKPLRSGKVFRVGDLMTRTEYPEQEHWGLYYAQSVSLTRFLVETGSPAQFIRFVQQSQRSGVEPALRQVYAIPDFDALQKRWLTYARENSSGSAALTASSADPEKDPGTPRE